MSDKHYDIAVIGSGDAGRPVAYEAAKKGKKVALIDKNPFGGTRALRGDIAKKILATPVEVACKIRRLYDQGIHMGSGGLSWREIQKWKEEYIERTSKQYEGAFEKWGIDVYHGNAQFVDTSSLTVNEDTIFATNIHIASGSKPSHVRTAGAELLAASDEFLNLSELPKRIIFIGGSYISFELAHIAAYCGSEVMILQGDEHVLPEFDSDLVAQLVSASAEIGVVVKTNQPLVRLEKQGSAYVVLTQEQGREVRENADLVVHGGARVPDVDGLDLEKAQVAFLPNGITVDKYLQSVSNTRVYAAGDVADTGPHLASKAIREGKIAAYNILHRTKQRIPDYTYIPSAVCTFPQLARAGYSEKQAREKRLDVDILFKKADEWFPTYKILTQKKTGKIVGAHVLGEQADALINFFAFAMQHKMTIDDIKKPLYTYPTALSSIEDMG